jgi:hypothetical protein
LALAAANNRYGISYIALLGSQFSHKRGSRVETQELCGLVARLGAGSLVQVVQAKAPDLILRNVDI